MRRKPLAAMLVLLSAALVLDGNALLDAGWGSALRSIADRVLPNPEIAMWAPAPEPGSHASSYADATGAGANYVYLVDAADDRGVGVNIFFTIFTNAFSPIAPTRIRRIRQRGCAAFGV